MIKKIIDKEYFFFFKKKRDIDQKKIDMTPSVCVTGENIIVDANDGNSRVKRINFLLFSPSTQSKELTIIYDEINQKDELINIYK